MKPHRARILAMQGIFQLEFHDTPYERLADFTWIDYKVPEEEAEFAWKLIKGVAENTESIDKAIEKYSKNWKIERISPVNKAILRISIFQLREMAGEVPYKVVMDEAIKLCNKYGEEDSSRFINGILDAYYRLEIEPQGDETPGK